MWRFLSGARWPAKLPARARAAARPPATANSAPTSDQHRAKMVAPPFPLFVNVVDVIVPLLLLLALSSFAALRGGMVAEAAAPGLRCPS